MMLLPEMADEALPPAEDVAGVIRRGCGRGGPLPGVAYLIGRDANRRGRNGWAWGLLFLWQPVIVGISYLFVRRSRPRH